MLLTPGLDKFCRPAIAPSGVAHGGFFLGPAVLPALKVIIHNKTDIQPSGPAS